MQIICFTLCITYIKNYLSGSFWMHVTQQGRDWVAMGHDYHGRAQPDPLRELRGRKGMEEQWYGVSPLPWSPGLDPPLLQIDTRTDVRNACNNSCVSRNVTVVE